MNEVCVVRASGDCVAGRVGVADSWWLRFRGLLGRPQMGDDQGLLLMACPSVHTVGMGYPIDVAFLDADGTVVRAVDGLGPWRVGLGGPGAVHALELPAGRLREAGIVPGTRLNWS